jgi:NTE family protein
MQKWGLALSGGGVRAAAHIGVLKALEENELSPDFISGTSSGSIVASLFAIGYSSDEIHEMFKKNAKKVIDDFDIKEIYFYLRDIFKRSAIEGLIQGDKILEVVRSYCDKKGCKSISQAKIPIAIPAVDVNTSKILMFVSNKSNLIDNGDVEYHDHIELAAAVRASSSLPGIFRPHMFNGKRLVDGGIRDNVPIDILKLMGAEKTVAVNLGYYGEAKEEIDSLFEILSQSINIMSYQISEQLLKNADAVVMPEVSDVKMLDTSKVEECFNKGYDAALKVIEQIKRTLIS